MLTREVNRLSLASLIATSAFYHHVAQHPKEAFTEDFFALVGSVSLQRKSSYSSHKSSRSSSSSHNDEHTTSIRPFSPLATTNVAYSGAHHWRILSPKKDSNNTAEEGKTHIYHYQRHHNIPWKRTVGWKDHGEALVYAMRLHHYNSKKEESFLDFNPDFLNAEVFPATDCFCLVKKSSKKDDDGHHHGGGDVDLESQKLKDYKKRKLESHQSPFIEIEDVQAFAFVEPDLESGCLYLAILASCCDQKGVGRKLMNHLKQYWYDELLSRKYHGDEKKLVADIQSGAAGYIILRAVESSVGFFVLHCGGEMFNFNAWHHNRTKRIAANMISNVLFLGGRRGTLGRFFFGPETTVSTSSTGRSRALHSSSKQQYDRKATDRITCATSSIADNMRSAELTEKLQKVCSKTQYERKIYFRQRERSTSHDSKKKGDKKNSDKKKFSSMLSKSTEAELESVRRELRKLRWCDNRIGKPEWPIRCPIVALSSDGDAKSSFSVNLSSLDCDSTYYSPKNSSLKKISSSRSSSNKYYASSSFSPIRSPDDVRSSSGGSISSTKSFPPMSPVKSKGTSPTTLIQRQSARRSAEEIMFPRLTGGKASPTSSFNSSIRSSSALGSGSFSPMRSPLQRKTAPSRSSNTHTGSTHISLASSPISRSKKNVILERRNNGR